MDKLQGGDWNSFFHKFEAVASQSTANVSRPSIVDDNVPLPIIRGHHFDIAYEESMDEHVKCQVCGMLLRRTMFAAHIRQRHAELCPPSMSTDDDSGRHSGIESPDINRNPNFPFSPKLMSPPVEKDSAKLTFSVKSQRKHKRRKTRRDRHTDDILSSPRDSRMLTPPTIDPGYEDKFFWRFGDRPGTSTQPATPNLLERSMPSSSLLKESERYESGDNVILRLSPNVTVRAALSDGDRISKKKRRKKTGRKD
ncbi:hypothetical protein KIN20_000831 [Parelaphostrongylus tenuis]|uniref:Uncharacterized protein n=1 Tax=Parelaphostrongylus tenuis TaxID=148309 RepID=A0AAD5MEC6_PARTN|nr:hypothetical protein KIN20_000831 [Parelaphostrongylus tenuis]